MSSRLMSVPEQINSVAAQILQKIIDSSGCGSRIYFASALPELDLNQLDRSTWGAG